jgi:hypothetical protein
LATVHPTSRRPGAGQPEFSATPAWERGSVQNSHCQWVNLEASPVIELRGQRSKRHDEQKTTQ